MTGHRVNVRLPEDLYSKVLSQSILEGRTIAQLMREALNRYMSAVSVLAETPESNPT